LTIRTFQSGDEAAQLRIYNDAAAHLPRFKPATLDEIRRRCQAADFDPTTRWFAIEDGQPVGYAAFHANGRLSYPWCLKGHEALAEPLFDRILRAVQERGMQHLFAAYRADWAAQNNFFLAHGFQQAREMVNFVLDLAELPTPAATLRNLTTPLRPADVPELARLGSGVIRMTTDPEKYFFHNPYFSSDAIYALRSPDGTVTAVGVLIVKSGYANPKQVDAAMPCFRLGALGTEGMQHKRINGLFSFVTAPGDVTRLGLDMLLQASFRLRSTNLDALAAQVPSDAPHLLRFYQHYFRRQAAFPVFERELGTSAETTN
jgi:hypothetical protein